MKLSQTKILHYFTINQSPLRLPSFSHFPLHPSIYKYLQFKDIHTPTYIQYALLSSLHKKQHNVHYLTSPTGSGKTLSYLLPICSNLKFQEQKNGIMTASKRPRGLILTVNKELVLQGRNVGKQISHHSKLKVQGINIGRSMVEQRNSLQNGLDILVSTHCRLIPLLQNQNLYLSNLKWIVIDQVDTFYQTGKLNLVMEKILSKVKNMQENDKNVNIIFSGTTHPLELKQFLESKFKNMAVLIDKNTHLNLQNIKHEFIQCNQLDKHETFSQVLLQRKNTKTLVFCNTKTSLHQLQYFLQERGISTLSLHSDLHKQARLQNYQLFRDGQKEILLSTDLGARGLDIPNLQRVINYDFPLSTCDYLQRAGRTGRAGKQGQTITLYHKKNMNIINQLRDASFTTPLKINNSAYRMKNRQQKRPK